MVSRLEEAPLQKLEVGKVARGAVDNGTRAESHQGADQDLRLLFFKIVLDVGGIWVSGRAQVVVVVLLVAEGLEQEPQIELGEALDGDTKGQKAQAGTNPSQEGSLGCKVVSGGGAGV